MKQKNKLKAAIVLSCLLLAAACNKTDDTSTTTKSASSGSTSGEIQLGKQLPNPYTVENMQKAYDSLVADGELKEDVQITATHLYVRYLPKDSTDVNALYADTSLEYFDYPLDYQITQEGNYYHDPSIAEGNPTWVYTVVPVNYVFPDVQHEVLQECYLPDDEASGLKSDVAEELEYEAYKITGNLDDDDSGLKSTNSKEKPDGTIRVYNDATNSEGKVIGYEGIKHVKVRVHNFIKWDTDYTDDNGYYKMSKKYATNVHYAIVFDNSKQFTIWGNHAMFAAANYNIGWDDNGGCNVDIAKGSQAWLWCIINNAAYEYFNYCDALGITTPPEDMRIWSMRVSCGWGGSTPMARNIGLDIDNLMDFLAIAYAAVKSQGWTVALSLCMPDMFIFHDGTENARIIFETVYHECAHASHFNQVGKVYWLKYITHIVSNLGYGDGSEKYAGYCGVGEIWGNYFGVECGKYKFGKVYDHFDPYEGWYHPGFFMDLDSCYGFTEKQLFASLTSDVNTIATLKTKLISLYPAQEVGIKKLYHNYYEL